MDIDRFGIAGIPFSGMPVTEPALGFGMALAMNAPAPVSYAGLTEARKEAVILRCKDARTREQMQKEVDALAPGMDVRQVYEEERESYR